MKIMGRALRSFDVTLQFSTLRPSVHASFVARTMGFYTLNAIISPAWETWLQKVISDLMQKREYDKRISEYELSNT